MTVLIAYSALVYLYNLTVCLTAVVLAICKFIGQNEGLRATMHMYVQYTFPFDFFH